MLCMKSTKKIAMVSKSIYWLCWYSTHWLSFKMQNDDPFPSCFQESSYDFDFVFVVVLTE